MRKAAMELSMEQDPGQDQEPPEGVTGGINAEGYYSALRALEEFEQSHEPRLSRTRTELRALEAEIKRLQAERTEALHADELNTVKELDSEVEDLRRDHGIKSEHLEILKDWRTKDGPSLRELEQAVTVEARKVIANYAAVIESHVKEKLHQAKQEYFTQIDELSQMLIAASRFTVHARQNHGIGSKYQHIRNPELRDISISAEEIAKRCQVPKIWPMWIFVDRV